MVKDILNQLGLLRNPCLVFGILGAILLFSFALKLLDSVFLEQRILGIVIVVAGVILIFATLSFYIYAYFRLSGTAQEMAFLNHIEEAVSADKGIRERRPAK